MTNAKGVSLWKIAGCAILGAIAFILVLSAFMSSPAFGQEIPDPIGTMPRAVGHPAGSGAPSCRTTRWESNAGDEEHTSYRDLPDETFKAWLWRHKDEVSIAQKIAPKKKPSPSAGGVGQLWNARMLVIEQDKFRMLWTDWDGNDQVLMGARWPNEGDTAYVLRAVGIAVESLRLDPPQF